MITFDAVLLALALGVDAAVVAFAIGLSHPDKSHRPGLKLALWFGSFQALMSGLGFGAVQLVDVVKPYAETAAGGIFILLGLKLIRDIFSDEQEERHLVPTHPRDHLLLAIATSLDALAAGVGLSGHASPWASVTLIGVVAFLMTWGGAVLSHHLKHLPERWLEAGGALILIFLGVKTLL